MNEIKLILPWAPSVNHYKSIGRTIKTKTGKIYQQRVDSRTTTAFYYQVYMRCKQQMPQEGVKFAHDATIKVGMTISLYPPNHRRYDIDNPLKVLCDSLVHAGALKDDSQICRLFVQKLAPRGMGEIEVVIYELAFDDK